MICRQDLNLRSRCRLVESAPNACHRHAASRLPAWSIRRLTQPTGLQRPSAPERGHSGCDEVAGPYGFEPAVALPLGRIGAKRMPLACGAPLRPNAGAQDAMRSQDQDMICRHENRVSHFHVTPCFRVGATGFEPATSASRTQRSTKLSHAPF